MTFDSHLSIATYQMYQTYVQNPQAHGIHFPGKQDKSLAPPFGSRVEKVMYNSARSERPRTEKLKSR